MAPPRTAGAQGHELQFACNHLGHFALTGLLLDLLAAGRRDARVVTVTSVNHRKAHLRFDDLNSERDYGPMACYDRSKLANAVFGHELHRRLTASGSPVRSLLAHPGYTATNLRTSGPTGLVKLLFGRVLRPSPSTPARAPFRSCTRRPTRTRGAATSSARTAPASCAADRPGWPWPRRPSTPRPGGRCRSS